MAKHFAVVDLDRIVKTIGVPLTILNDLPSETEDDRKAIDALIMTTYDNTDILSSIPSCQCGTLTKGYNLGKVCKVCETPVGRPVETPITANVLLRAPDQVAGFISPVAWIHLTNALSSTGYNIMEWLTNPSSIVPSNTSKTVLRKIQIFEAHGWVRGLNNFINNFDHFLSIIPALKLKDEAGFIEWLVNNRRLIFSRHLAMPTKALLVLENTSVGSFADLPITGAIDAAKTLVSITKKDITYSTPYIEKKVVSIIKNLSTYLWDTIKFSFNKKRGWLRGQLFRSRAHFCMRGVITSISAPHDYEEVWIPWAQGLECLKFHIVNRLYMRGVNPSVGFALVEASGKVYVPILDQIMQEIIRDCKGKGIPIILQRNPSLIRGSAQNLFITRVKSNIEDQTISFSILCTKGLN